MPEYDNTITGDENDNDIRGGAGNDLILGLAGNDTLAGRGGDDGLFGGDGEDYLRGGDGNDLIYGEDGNDRIMGDSGNDTIYGGAGADDIQGNDGDDVIYGDDGNDRLFGQNGNDTLHGGAGDDFLNGGAGYDVAVYDGSIYDHVIVGNGTSVIAPDGSTDNLRFVEELRFDDHTYLVGVNNAPFTTDDNVDGSSAAITDMYALLSNDNDIDGDSFAITSVSASGSGAVVTLNTDGSVSYDPNGTFDGLAAGQTATDTFTYTVTDANGATATATVTMSIRGSSTIGILTAFDDIAAVDEDQSIVINVLANDFDPEGDVLNIIAIGGMAIATGQTVDVGQANVTLNANGTLTVAPDPNFNGSLSFDYTVSDGADFATATVDVTVNPIAAPAVIVFGPSSSFDIGVQAGEPGDVVETVVLSGLPAGSVLSAGTASADGSTWTFAGPPPAGLTFTPPTGYSGTFQLRVNVLTRDGVSTFSTDAFQSVTINGTDPGTNDTLNGGAGADFLDGGAGNDVINGRGGNDTLLGGTGDDYMRGGTGDDLIDGGDGNDTILGDAGDDLIFGGLGNDDIRGNAGNDEIHGGDGNDSLYGQDGNDTIIGGAGDDFINGGNGVDTAVFSGSIFDYAIASNGLSISGPDGNDLLRFIEILQFDDYTYLNDGTNNGPFTRADAVDASVSGTNTFTTLLNNDVDLEGDAFSITSVVASGSGALVVLLSDGSVSYDANGAFPGLAAGDTATDTFTYTVTDARGATRTETVTVTVNGSGATNAPPAAVDDSVTTDEDVPVVVAVLANDSDPETDPLAVTAIAGQAVAPGGSVDIGQAIVTLNVDGTLTVAPAADMNGEIRFAYTVSDGSLTDEGEVVVTVNPVAAPAAIGINPADPFAITVSATEAGETVGAVVLSGLPAGTILSAGTPNADGTEWTFSGPPPVGLTFTRPAGFSGTFDLTVTATTIDGTDTETAFATQAVTIQPIVGTITLDGSLSDWSANDRLDDAATGVPGYAFYGVYQTGTFIFAIESTGGVIGPNTTIWLNSDFNTGTGFQVFGTVVGAEYNININADGSASLFTGDAGQTLVVASLDIAYSADGTIAEIALPANLMAGTPTGANVYADVNDLVFLPNSFSDTSFIVAQTLPPITYGDLTLDGNLGDWAAADLLSTNGANAFYGAYEAGALVFALQSGSADIGPNTTVWLNTDFNTGTGYQVFGSGVGAEYNINFNADGTASLYSGGAGQTLVAANIDVRYSADRQIAEFAIDADLLAGSPRAVNVYADINDIVFLPQFFSDSSLVVRDDTPLPVNESKMIAIVFSETTQANFYNSTAYAQLIMSAQGQAMQAGIPYQLISESDLTDPAALAQYGAIVFPAFSHVPSALVSPITSALAIASNSYGVGLIAAGDFMTNDETGAALPGNSYARMQSLLGVTVEGFGATTGIEIRAADTSHPVSDDYTPDELVDVYTNISFGHYMDVTGEGQVLFSQVVNGGAETHDAVIATTTGGRNVHFSSDAVIGNSNILWEAIDWAVNGDAPGVSLSMTRGTGLFASRNDMDQSQELFDVVLSEPGIYDEMIPILQDFYDQYGFTGSYYINVGNNPPDQQTDWTVSAPYYQALIALESEIGTHSYTHPDNTNLLSPSEIQFEFQVSAAEIEAALGIVVRGAALPGAPEGLATALEIIQYFDYISGGYSSEGAGYPNAFGYLTPDAQNGIYIAPNMSFDFTFIEFQGLTAAQAEAAWAAEYADLQSHAGTPIYVFPWHDYGLTNWDTGAGDVGYTLQMFESVISRAYADGVEFVTLADLADRMRMIESATVDISTTATGYDVTVGASDVGTFSLKVDDGQTIRNVGNWYAFSDTAVFLPASGGTFQITTGATADDVTHIASLPMRADLASVTGDGQELDFAFSGRGDVGISLASWGGNSVVATGADRAALSGDMLTLGFDTVGSHVGGVDYVAGTTVVGSAGNDAVIAGSGDQIINAGLGDDTIFSELGSDRFVFFAGDGNDTIFDTDAVSAGVDVLDLANLEIMDVTLERIENDLFVTVDTTGDVIRIVDQFVSSELTPGEGIEQIVFSGEITLDRAEIAASTLLF